MRNYYLSLGLVSLCLWAGAIVGCNDLAADDSSKPKSRYTVEVYSGGKLIETFKPDDRPSSSGVGFDFYVGGKLVRLSADAIVKEQ